VSDDPAYEAYVARRKARGHRVVSRIDFLAGLAAGRADIAAYEENKKFFSLLQARSIALQIENVELRRRLRLVNEVSDVDGVRV
jgi:hypothetical protein